MANLPRSDERLGRRRRFGLLLAAIAIACAGGGFALAGPGGLVGVVGLVLLAQGIGLGVAAGTLIVGHNPLDKKDRAGAANGGKDG